jgi:transcriptional regulator with XRE-family HTH domain
MVEATLLPEDERRRRIASLIRRARVRQELSAPELGKLVGRTRGTINDWEKGTSTPSLADLGPLCVALKVDPKVFADLPPTPIDPLEDYLILEEVQRATELGLHVVAEAEADLTQAKSRSTPQRPSPGPANRGGGKRSRRQPDGRPG